MTTTRALNAEFAGYATTSRSLVSCLITLANGIVYRQMAFLEVEHPHLEEHNHTSRTSSRWAQRHSRILVYSVATKVKISARRAPVHHQEAIHAEAWPNEHRVPIDELVYRWNTTTLARFREHIMQGMAAVCRECQIAVRTLSKCASVEELVQQADREL